MGETDCYIVDDDAAVARSLKILLLSAGIISTAYESAADFLAAIGGLRPGLLTARCVDAGRNPPIAARKSAALSYAVDIIPADVTKASLQ